MKALFNFVCLTMLLLGSACTKTINGLAAIPQHSQSASEKAAPKGDDLGVGAPSNFEVKVVDRNGNGISNARVTALHGDDADLVVTTKSDGTAALSLSAASTVFVTKALYSQATLIGAPGDSENLIIVTLNADPSSEGLIDTDQEIPGF